MGSFSGHVRRFIALSLGVLHGSGLVRYYINRHVAEVGSRATQEELALITKLGERIEFVRGGKI